MANEFNYYQAVDGNWTNVNNWSEGSVPAVTEQVVIDKTAMSGETIIDINTNLPAAGSGIEYDSVRTGPHFKGQLGTAALPLNLGVVDDIWIESPLMTAIYLAVDTGDALANLHVLACQPGMTVNLMRAGAQTGTFANVFVYGGLGLNINATGVATNLFMLQPSSGSPGTATIETGGAVTTVIQTAGTLNSNAAITTYSGSGGLLNQVGDTNFNIATINNWGATVNYHSKGGLIGLLNMYAGLTNFVGGERRVRTVTNTNQYGGIIDARTGGRFVSFTNAPSKKGGELLGDVGQDFTIEAADAL